MMLVLLFNQFTIIYTDGVLDNNILAVFIIIFKTRRLPYIEIFQYMLLLCEFQSVL